MRILGPPPNEPRLQRQYDNGDHQMQAPDTVRLASCCTQLHTTRSIMQQPGPPAAASQMVRSGRWCACTIVMTHQPSNINSLAWLRVLTRWLLHAATYAGAVPLHRLLQLLLWLTGRRCARCKLQLRCGQPSRLHDGHLVKTSDPLKPSCKRPCTLLRVETREGCRRCLVFLVLLCQRRACMSVDPCSASATQVLN